MPRLRTDLLVPFLFALLLAFGARVLFGSAEDDWWKATILYFAAACLFLYAWLASRGTGAFASSHFSLHLAILPLINRRIVLSAVSVILVLIAVADSLASPHPGPYLLATAAWLLAIAALALAFIPRPAIDLENWQTAFTAHWSELVFVVAMVAAAGLLREFDLEHVPLNFGGDEGEMGMVARSFLQGDAISPFATSWMAHQNLWFWMQSLVLGMFGQSVASLRLLSAVFGTLGVLAVYLLVRELFGRLLAGVSALLLAVMPFHLHFSRVAISSIPDPFWSAMVLFLLIRGVRTRCNGYFVAAGIALGYSQYLYHGMRLLIITLSAFFVLWIAQDRRVLTANWRNWATGVFASLVTAAPLIGFYLTNPDQFWEHYNAMGIVPSGWLARTALETGSSQISIILDRMGHALLFYNLTPDLSGFYAPGTPLLDTLSGVFFVLGLGYSIYRIADRRYYLFVAWFLLALFFGAVMVLDENGSERLVTTSIPVIFFVALGLTRVSDLAARILSGGRMMQRAFVAAAVAALILIDLQFYFMDYTPRRTYSGDGGWTFTEMSRLFLAQTVPFKVYFFGAPYDFIDHGTIRYMVPNLEGIDVDQPLQSAPDFVDNRRRALFVFTPKRPDDFQFVQQAYPQGQRIDYIKPDGQELFYVYQVDHP